MRLSLGAVAQLLLVAPALAKIRRTPGQPKIGNTYLDVSEDKEKIIPVAEGYFQQLIDHNNPSLGTFTQRWWWNADHYRGPGSPIVLNTPGEENADGYQGYCTNVTLPGLFAQETGGAAVMVEHRFWGGSSPYDKLTAETLQLLNLEQAIADLVYFANNVELPFDPTNSSKPDKAPWILSGGSYSGALTAWTSALAPGTFWAYQATSAVVQDIPDLWAYFDPVKEAMPQNCSTDMVAVISQVDHVLLHGSASEQHMLKSSFGFGPLENDDFASALTDGLFYWQSQQFYVGYNPLQQMCDYMENKWPGSRGPTPGANGVGAQKALKGLAKWFRQTVVPGGCESYGYWKRNNTLACWDTHNKNSPIYTDTTVNNTVDRQWQWMLCNQPFEWFQTWAPVSNSGLVSQLDNYEYQRRQCEYYFPEVNGYTYGLNSGKTPSQLNAITQGWDYTNSTRLLWVNGGYDPWRPATVSSDQRPGGRLQSTKEAPVWVIPKASHCNDLILENGKANAGAQKVIDAEVKQMKQWVEDYYSQK